MREHGSRLSLNISIHAMCTTRQVHTVRFGVLVEKQVEHLYGESYCGQEPACARSIAVLEIGEDDVGHGSDSRRALDGRDW